MQHYVVYLGEHSFHDSESVITANHEMLASVIGRYIRIYALHSLLELLLPQHPVSKN